MIGVRLTPEACYALWHAFLKRWAEHAPPCPMCRPWAQYGPYGRAYRVALAEPVADIRAAALAYEAAARSGRGHAMRQPDGDPAVWETSVEASRRLGVDPRTIRRWAASGRLRARKLGDRWLIDADADRPEDQR